MEEREYKSYIDLEWNHVNRLGWFDVGWFRKMVAATFENEERIEIYRFTIEGI